MASSRLLSRSVLLPADGEGDIFSAGAADVAHHPRKSAEQLLDRHHADLHDRTLQLAEHARLKGDGVGQPAANGLLGVTLRKITHGLLQHGFADDQLAHQIQNIVDSLGVDPQNIFRPEPNLGVAAAPEAGGPRSQFGSKAGASAAGAPARLGAHLRFPLDRLQGAGFRGREGSLRS
jgi:hypothetical protein